MNGKNSFNLEYCRALYIGDVMVPIAPDPLVLENDKLPDYIANFREHLSSAIRLKRPTEFTPLSYRDYCAFRIKQVESQISDRCCVFRILDDGSVNFDRIVEENEEIRKQRYPNEKFYYEFILSSLDVAIDIDLSAVCDLLMGWEDKEQVIHKFVTLYWLNRTISEKYSLLMQSTFQESKVEELKDLKSQTYTFYNQLDRFIKLQNS